MPNSGSPRLVYPRFAKSISDRFDTFGAFPKKSADPDIFTHHTGLFFI
jgi:hypothetical protein